ncbi:hypothetical protein M0R45_032769 [Rubus argutus]|uniref:Retroviral polymerase SH3-like domain-containing protein n=1 Tax=Rubus argutus TaxID=59490 RepID=A0AAW1WK97_RUBAR
MPTNTRTKWSVREEESSLLDMARALLFSAHVPKYLWSDAVQTSSHLINRLPSSVLQGKIPLEVLASHVSLPSFHNLPARVFGCIAFVHIPQNQRSKLDARALKCVFVGYGGYQKGYKCYHPPTRRYYVTMDVTFFEDMSYFSSSDTALQGENSYFEELYHIEVHLETEAPSIQVPVQITRSETEDTTVPSAAISIPDPQLPGNEDHSYEVYSRVNLPKGMNPLFIAKSKYPIANYMSTMRLSKSYESFVNQISAVSVPNKVQDALGDPSGGRQWRGRNGVIAKNNTCSLYLHHKARRL